MENSIFISRLRIFIVFGVLSLFLFTVPTAFAYSNNMSASVVVGQADFLNGGINQGGSTVANSLRNPGQVWVVDNKMIVADADNNRVLIYNKIPTSNNASADVVLGQPNLISNTEDNGGISAATLDRPFGVWSDGTRLIVSESDNNRVLIWNQFPTANRKAADVVVGQTTMTGSGTGASASTLNQPTGVTYDKSTNKLLIFDATNNRVLVYDGIPTTNGASASVVIGQQDFNGSTANQGGSAGANTLALAFTAGVGTFNGKLFIGDRVNNRVLIYNQIPTTSNASADVVIGQSNFTSTSPNQGGSISASGLQTAGGAQVDENGRMFVMDRTNARILIFNQIPTENNASADVVIGQSDFTSVSLGTSEKLLKANPFGVSLFQDHLFVSDSGNHRVLIFDNILSGPKLSLSGVSAIENGKLRLSGNIQIGERGKYNLHDVGVSVNGSGYSHATNEDSGIANGETNSFYTFFHDFEPWSNNNGIADAWRNDNAAMTNSQGYTANIRSTSSNGETDTLFYFAPFTLNKVTSGMLPSITFSVSSHQLDRIKGSITNFQVKAKKQGTDSWITWIDNIAVVSDQIAVNPKTILPAGNYDIQAVAKDNWGHTQAVTNTLSYISTGSSFISQKPSTSVTKEWFPLQINSISGVQSGIISSFMSHTKSSYQTSSTKPTVSGIAFNGTTVTMQVTDTKSGKTRIYQTLTQNSVWILRPQFFSSSLVDVWVTDSAGHYNEIASLTISVQ